LPQCLDPQEYFNYAAKMQSMQNDIDNIKKRAKQESDKINEQARYSSDPRLAM
jgi:molecular chaperone GrpE (heat shock protein)